MARLLHSKTNIVALAVLSTILLCAFSLTSAAVAAFVPRHHGTWRRPRSTNIPSAMQLKAWKGGDRDSFKGNTKKTAKKVGKTQSPDNKEKQRSFGTLISSFGKLFDRPRYDWVNNKAVDEDTDPISKARVDWSSPKRK